MFFKTRNVLVLKNIFNYFIVMIVCLSRIW